MPSKLRQASQKLKEKAQEGLSFNFNDVEMKLTKNNTAYRVTCSNGQVITWFETYKSGFTCDDIVEEIDDSGNMQVIHGVTVSADGSLIPAGMQGGVWD